MIDLEQRLRDDLSAAAGAWEAEVDAEDVLAAGRSVRRGRTIRRLGMAAAAMVAVTSLSIVAAPPIIAQILAQQTVTASQTYKWGVVDSEFDQVAVRVSREDKVTTAVVTGLRAGKQVASVSQVLPQPLTDPIRLELGNRASVAILPGKVAYADLVLRSAGPDSGVRVEWLDTFGISVAVAQLADSVGGPDGLDWVWLDEAGAVHTIGGTPVGRLRLGGESPVVYYSKAHNVLGVIGVQGDDVSFPADSVAPSLMLADPRFFNDAVAYQFGVFPSGTHDLKLRLTDPKGQWAAVTLSDGTQVAIAKVPAHHTQVVRGLSYRTAEGKAVTLGR